MDSHQITAWRAEVIAHVETRPTPKKEACDETIRQLAHEILRKDNALAEASARRILQKKSTGSGGTDTRPQRDRVGSNTGAGAGG